MTEVPSEYVLDPDEWQRQICKLCDNLAGDIASILDEHHRPEAVAEALQVLFRPYLTDEPPSAASQLWAEVEEGHLRAGDTHANAVELTFDDSAGRWRSIHPDTRADEDPDTSHRRLADTIVETVWFGDPDIRRQVVRMMEHDHELVADYLQPLDTLERPRPTAPRPPPGAATCSPGCSSDTRSVSRSLLATSCGGTHSAWPTGPNTTT